MRADIIIAALLFQLALVLIVGIFSRKASKSATTYLLADRNLNVFFLIASWGTISLGSMTTVGYMEMAGAIGMQTMWHVTAGALTSMLGLFVAGSWFRRVQARSVPEIFESMFGLLFRLLMACVLFTISWAMMTLDGQAGGLFISGLTGFPIAIGIALMLVVSLLYPLIGGLKQAAYMNIINYPIFVIAGVLLVIYTGKGLPGGWAPVGQVYSQTPWFINFWKVPWEIPDIAIGFGLGVFLAAIGTMCGPLTMVTAMAAKSEQTLRKAAMVIPFFTLIVVYPWVLTGLGVSTLPIFRTFGPKTAGVMFIISNFPPVVSGFIIAAVMGAIISTFSMLMFGCVQIFTNDIYARLINPNATDAELVKVARLTMVGLVLLVFFPTTLMPGMVAAIYWLVAWFIPPTFALISGLFWKKATVAWLGTSLIVYVINAAWSFTSLPALLGIPGYIHNVYPVTVLTIIIGGLWTALSKAPAGYFVSHRSEPIQSATVEGGMK